MDADGTERCVGKAIDGWIKRVALLFIALLFTPTLAAQTTTDVGGFRVQFIQPGDGGAGGVYVGVGGSDASGRYAADIVAPSAAQTAAFSRAFEYWTDVLNLPPAAGNPAAPVIRVVIRNVGLVNANALAFDDPSRDQGLVMSRILDGDTTPGPDGIDGRVIFFNPPGGFSLNPTTQLDGSATYEAIAIHEIAHALGIANVSFVVPQTGGAFDLNGAVTTTDNEPFTDLLQNINVGGNRAEFAGTNARAVFGGAGGPVSPPVQVNDTHLIIPFHTMTRGSSIPPGGGAAADFRNSPAFLPVELALMKDLGYNITLSDHFGSAYYQDNVTDSTGSSTPTARFGVGVYIQSDGSTITVDGNQTVSGDYGTGVRINGGQEGVEQNSNGTVLSVATTNGNMVTVEQGVTIDASGTGGIGLLQSAGANNVIIHRGDITANGAGGRGMVFDLGSDNLFNPISQAFYGLPAATQVDITGSIASSGNAIEVGGNSFVQTFNIMNGASISGDIVNGSGFTGSVVVFGRQADASGQAIAASSDANFQFTFNDDIQTRVLPVFGGVMSAQLAGGETTLNGLNNFEIMVIDAPATLSGTGAVATESGILHQGTIAPGPAIETFDIVGDMLTQNGMHEVDINSAGTTPGVNSDLVTVTGTNQIDGGQVAVSSGGEEIAVGSVYTFLQTGTLVVNTPFLFSDDMVNRAVVGDFDGTDYRFIVIRDAAFGVVGQSFNQMSVGGYLDAVAANPDVTALNTLINGLPFDADVQNALDQLGGEVYGTQLATRLNSTSTFLDLVTTQLRSSASEGCCRRAPQGNLSFWNQSYGWGGAIQTDGNAHGAHNSAGGTAFGLTETYGDAIAGVFYGYEGAYLSVGDLRSTIQSDIHRYGCHVATRSDEGYLRLLAMGGHVDSDASRTVVIGSGGGIAETNHANIDGWSASLDMEGGRSFCIPYGCLQPIVGWRYMHLDQSSFTESGAGVSRLAVSGSDFDLFRTRVGFDAMVRLTSWWNTSASLTSFWMHDFVDPIPGYSAALAVADQASFAARGTTVGRDHLVLSPGLNCYQGNVRLWANYLLDANHANVLHTGAGGMEVVW